ncbi:MAG: NAD-dependent epimerase/dehydratase family protein [Caulobacteraceae bacterium]
MQVGFFKNKRVLITGANGFIGSHAVMRMVAEGADVSVLVREASDMWRLEKLNNCFDIYKADMRDADKVSEYVGNIKPDYVFHLAAYGVDSRQKEYVSAASTNIIGTINLLNALIDRGCEKFIHAGTSMQYGNKESAVKEEQNYTPSNIYGSTKAAATIIAHQIAQENGIDIATIIPFGVFGENEGSHKFFPHIILSILADKDIELSPCEQYRDYCYIENIIDGFLLAAQDKNVKNEIFNIGSGKLHKLRYYIELILNKMKTDRKAIYGSKGYRKNDLWSPEPDIGKISSILGWKPSISLDEGIDRTIGWYRENYEKYLIKGR